MFQDLLEEVSHANAALHDVAWFLLLVSARRHIPPNYATSSSDRALMRVCMPKRDGEAAEPVGQQSSESMASWSTAGTPSLYHESSWAVAGELLHSTRGCSWMQLYAGLGRSLASAVRAQPFEGWSLRAYGA